MRAVPQYVIPLVTIHTSSQREQLLINNLDFASFTSVAAILFTGVKSLNDRCLCRRNLTSNLLIRVQCWVMGTYFKFLYLRMTS